MDDQELAQEIFEMGCSMNRASADMFGLPWPDDTQDEAHELELEREAGILTALSHCRNAGVEEKQITILACELGVMDMWKRYA